MAQFMASELIAMLEEARPVKRSNKRSSEPLQAPLPKRHHPITSLSKRGFSPACRPDIKKRRLNADGCIRVVSRRKRLNTNLIISQLLTCLFIWF